MKHVALVEEAWVDFIVRGPDAIGSMDDAAQESHAAGFRMLKGDFLESLLATYASVASATSEVVQSTRSLDESQPLPDAPWFEAGACWSARRVLLHIIAEAAQHSGHADIIRESLDGAKTTG